ncbi:MAG: hypothetical protein HY896_10300 [Deltaproteobacteria bacterium]|nr:hypothetical protein [Deltaproteobacteria bacterium]
MGGRNVNGDCAWCGSPLAPVDKTADEIITHCFCRGCREDLFTRQESCSLQEYLDRLNIPILLLNSDAGIVTGNHAACKNLGIDHRHVDGRRWGDAIECINSRLPGGCGKSVHCRICTVRATVTDTYLTSQNHYQVRAFADCATPEGVRKIRFLISTEKLGDLVLLRIDAFEGKKSAR